MEKSAARNRQGFIQPLLLNLFHIHIMVMKRMERGSRRRRHPPHTQLAQACGWAIFCSSISCMQSVRPGLHLLADLGTPRKARIAVRQPHCAILIDLKSLDRLFRQNRACLHRCVNLIIRPIQKTGVNEETPLCPPPMMTTSLTDSPL